MENKALSPCTWTEMEGALRRMQTAAAAGQFAATVMHEINNPLEAISNLVYLIEVDAKNADRVQEYARQIAEQLRSVTQIAHRTLSFYRSPDTMEAIDLAVLTESAVKLHRSRLLAKRVALLPDIPSSVIVTGHAGEILQVISNLLANSIDALPSEGKVTIRIRRHCDEIRLTIADNGHGIPSEIRERIFDPFFSTKKNQGTGLGLAVSKGIIERHRGTIRLRTSVRVGKSGTLFLISLPAASQVHSE